MDKKDYEALGYQHATNGDKRLFAVDTASWQASAYWRGVRRRLAEEANEALADLKKAGDVPVPAPNNMLLVGGGAEGLGVTSFMAARDPGKARHIIDLSRMAANTKGWPTGAQEHAKRLAADLNQEFNVRRRARLTRALVRLQSRYAAKKPAPKIWVDELVG